MTIITLHHLFFGHCVNLSVIVLDLSIFLWELRSLRKIPRSKTITSDFHVDKKYLLCFTNPSLLVFGGIVCYVGVETLVKGAGTKLPGLWTKQEGWSVSHGRIKKMFMLICWLQSWLMWWLKQVIHYPIGSRVNWFLDLAACICRDWPISFLLCSTGNQNSQCKLSERHNFH